MCSIKKVLEVHCYAPELNKVHFFRNNIKLGSMPLKGDSITDYRKQFKKPDSVIRHVSIEFYYDDPDYKWLDKTINGTASYPFIRDFIRHELAKNPGAKLLDGSYLPAIKHRILSLKIVAV